MFHFGKSLNYKVWLDQRENEYMSAKLTNAKSKINMQCPESFSFSKNRKLIKNSINIYKM
jgi:hypothetical protein